MPHRAWDAAAGDGIRHVVGGGSPGGWRNQPSTHIFSGVFGRQRAGVNGVDGKARRGVCKLLYCF